ncbi:MAG: hypothetical protein A4E48_01419 [Methanosaeta sp. PtaU1.Bin060]|nr:MAG: hypothetical protein A4E48_01419 [Methanosaeta sp. PtaU1.Bin060]
MPEASLTGFRRLILWSTKEIRAVFPGTLLRLE